MLRLRAPEPRWAREWLGLERIAHAVVVRPSLSLAHALARFDDHVLDRTVMAAAGAVPVLARIAARADDRILDAGVDATAHAADVTGQLAARVDDDGVDRGVEILAGRVRRLGHLARIPQTGAIHQYFLQAVAVLAIGVVAWSVYAVMG